MSPNSDNAMARFLFAILKQKNLKDIDWNQVAQDPVLLQPITNGHAARMRYSRFRATVTGHEPQKRGRHGEHDRVAKPSKKSPPSKKDSIIKSESGVSLASLAQYSPASDTSPYMGVEDDFNTRFLTPCSDDISQTISVHPAGVKESCRKGSNAFASLLENSDLFTDPGSLTHSPAFSAFDAAFDLSNYNAGSADPLSHDLSEFNGADPLIHCQEWNDRFDDSPLF